MKKLLYFILAAGLISACSNDEPIATNDNGAKTTLLSPQEAISIAQNLAESRSSISRSTETAKVSDYSIIGSGTSRSSSDTLIYAVNYENNQGYALISAAKLDEPIIGYTDAGRFDIEKAEENEAFSFYLDAAKNYVASNIPLPPNPGFKPVELPKTKIYAIFPKVTVEWGQIFPEGLFCPNGICGCVQTAMAQMMSYLKAPASIQLTYPNRDKETQNLDWEALRQHKKSLNSVPANPFTHYSECSLNEEGHLALARLCRELGYRNEATYYEDATGAFGTSAYFTFKSLLPNTHISDYNSLESPYTTLYKQMEDGDGVAYVQGFTGYFGSGHAWVCDGGEHHETEAKMALGDGTYLITMHHTYYYHYNWGWCGKDNGYFRADVFDTGKAYKSRYDFKYNVSYFIVYK